MSITSLAFVAFAAVLAAAYYLVPKRFQWVVLLLFSAVFYLMSGPKHGVYILVTALSAYACALWMARVSQGQKAFFQAHKELSREEKGAIRQKNTRRKRLALIAALLLNFGLLSVFKYAHFVLDQINRLLGLFGGFQFDNSFSILVPLGISFYTFQTMGYLIDVYWDKAPPERNFFKLLLFTSFFPQITQGPISGYSQLSCQFLRPHSFSYENFAAGCQRMIWGYFKKLVLADTLAPCVHAVFENYAQYSGPAVLTGVFFYSIQIYADFSGYMDIMCGLCQVLDIRLEENFLRPYFSKSIAEYWRRWHITLGAWFKSYIYYPIAVSKWNTRLGKWARGRFGKTFGQALPASIALVAVWLVTGIWHGASWAYIAWGGVNGLFIIVSLWLEPLYQWGRDKLHLRESSFGWRLFQVARTYLLVCFIKVLPEVGGLRQGLGLWRQVFTGWRLPSFAELFPYGMPLSSLTMVAVATGALLLVSLLQRKGSVRAWFGRAPLPVRAFTLAVLLVLTVYFGVPASGNVGGFLYAQF